MVQSPATVDAALIQEIVHRILTVTKPDRIILFGSAATGNMNRDSDIDLLVVEPAPSKSIDYWVQIRRSLKGLGYPFDLFLIDTSSFEASKGIFGGLAYPAHKYGRTIYEAA